MKDSSITTSKKNLLGITLIEVLIYLALFGLFFITMVQFFFFLEDSQRVTAETLKIDNNIIFLTQHLEDTFSDNTAVDFVESDLNVDNGYLEFISTDNYYFDAEEIQFNGTAVTREDLIVEKFLLERIDDKDNNNIGIRVTTKLTSDNDGTVTREFSNSYLFD